MKPRAVASGNVAVVLMDWQVPNGTASVMASADGSASIYSSSGGGFIGGGQNHTEIRESALHAIALANQEYANAPVVTDTPLPPSGTVYFYFRTNDGLHRAEAKEAELRSGINPLSSLGNTMQQIVTRYRLMSPTN